MLEPSNNPTLDLAVLLDEQCCQQCTELAMRLQLPLIQMNSQQICPYSYVLTYSAKGLALQQMGPKAAGPVVVDFIGGSAQFRRLSGRGELIVKAVGGSKLKPPSVIDATAGLGRDSFVLASWGYPVIALERSSVVASLLADALARAHLSDDPTLQDVMARLQILQVEAIDYLQGLEADKRPDVIYIDPMFPETTKSALVKKQMRAIQQVIGADQDSTQLLSVALQTARYRVVVKRPKKADFVAQRKPGFSVEGKAIRFDVYSLKSYKK